MPHTPLWHLKPEMFTDQQDKMNVLAIEDFDSDDEMLDDTDESQDDDDVSLNLVDTDLDSEAEPAQERGEVEVDVHWQNDTVAEDEHDIDEDLHEVEIHTAEDVPLLGAEELNNGIEYHANELVDVHVAECGRDPVARLHS